MRFPVIWRTGAVLILLLASSWASAASLQIALLLPQSGRMAKAAEAVRDGFLAAYYQDSQAAAESPALHFYDSAAQDIVTLLLQAKDNGADLVIGPLDHEQLDALVKAGPPPLPILALNIVDGQADHLFQFALAPEDEIQRLVEWMEQQNVQHPLLLTAADDTSRRQQKIFQSLWQTRHPGTLPTHILDPSRKGGIAASIRDLTRGSGKHDALFLASPSLARQVQPALTYYHSPLPLYSLASAWDPTADASGQKDLDGLRFCDLPWMLEDTRPEQQTLYESLTRPVSGYDRLYAFGADTWTLANHWQALQDGEALSLRSGRVQPDRTGHLHRTPTCVEVRNGTATPLWSPDSKPDNTGTSL